MTARRVILDTDVLSMFAKIDELQLLETFFGKSRLAVTPAIYQELMAPIGYGYRFPEKVFPLVSLTLLTVAEKQSALDLQKRSQRLGHGEAEALSLCQARKWFFVSNDAVALRTARKINWPHMGLGPLFRQLWTRGVIAKQETAILLERIVQADRIVFSPSFRSENFTEEPIE